MILRHLHIEGYRGFGEPFQIEFSAGLNVLVGANASGKSNIIDAIRMILQEDEFGRSGCQDTDFHRPFGEAGTQLSKSICVCADFTGLSETEQIAFLPWTDKDGDAKLTLQIDNKLTRRDKYKRRLWGGASSSSMFEWELMDTINCVYLPPLRDAEARLREGRGSRLARLFRSRFPKDDHGNDQGNAKELTDKVEQFNETTAIAADLPIAEINESIRGHLKDAVGQVFGQDTIISFSEARFDRIVESLRLLFFPRIGVGASRKAFRNLRENSLGFNNLLYIATVLAEMKKLETPPQEGEEYLRLLLIEEPEAHLHPQLQTVLLKYLETQARQEGFQVIVTTHSPVLASAASLNSVIHLSCPDDGTPRATRLPDCGLSEQSSSFVSRWLDVTKSTLLFARGVILVEGISEALLLPEMARRIIKECKVAHPDCQHIPDCLEDAGISVINMGGIYFTHFMQLFCNVCGVEGSNLPVRCAGITDLDPDKDKLPTPSDLADRGKNPVLRHIPQVNSSEHCRLYSAMLKTFEYDLALEDANLATMFQVLAELRKTAGSASKALERQAAIDWKQETEQSKAVAASKLLGWVSRDQVGKGLYAQSLAAKLQPKDNVADVPFSIPAYIQDAVKWVLEIEDE